MKQRKLGPQDVPVSAIGFGCWGLSGAYGSVDEAEATATLNNALDSGISLFDTADCYGDGHNERLVGRALRRRRKEFILATKTGFVTRKDVQGKAAVTVDNRPSHIRGACEGSLERLQTDLIDLYYLHRIDPNVAIEESVGAVAELVQEGKVRWLGLCEVSAANLRRAMATHRVTAVQSEYSLWTRDVEAEVLPACRELDIALVPFSPLGRGFLTGCLTSTAQFTAGDWRATNPRFSSGNLQRNATLLAPLQQIADAHDCSVAQVALAWVLSRGQRVIPIPGTRRREHLDENLRALDVRLAADDLELLDTSFPLGIAAGDRYTPDFSKWIDR